jgi:hypothetical protein
MVQEHRFTRSRPRRVVALAIIVSLLATGSLSLVAQTSAYRFAHQFGDASSTSVSGGMDVGSAIVHDASGNTYVTGRFEGTIDFDPGAGIANLTALGKTDAFIAKYDANGGYIWAFRLGGTLTASSSLDEGVAIAVDGSDNVVVTGNIAGSDDFDPGAGVATLTSASASTELFVAKYTAAGAYVWAFLLRANSPDGVAIDANDNVLVTGKFTGTTDFDPGAGTASHNSLLGDPFVAKYSPAGAFAWVAKITPSSKYFGNAADVRGVASDPAGNVYIAGSFQGTVNIGKGNVKSAMSDIYLTKFSPTGQCAWAHRIGGSSSEFSTDVVADASGVYITGTFSGTVDFNPANGSANRTGSSDLFVAKYTLAGAYSWVFAIDCDGGRDLALGSDGDLYVSGAFTGAVDADPGTGTATLTNGTAAVGVSFLGRYTSAGTYVAAFGIDCTNGMSAYGVTVASNDDIFVTGQFRGTADFDPSAATAAQTSSYGSDIFVAGYGITMLPKAVRPPTQVKHLNPVLH